jgi:hypothetical protein
LAARLSSFRAGSAASAAAGEMHKHQLAGLTLRQAPGGFHCDKRAMCFKVSDRSNSNKFWRRSSAEQSSCPEQLQCWQGKSTKLI